MTQQGMLVGAHNKELADINTGIWNAGSFTRCIRLQQPLSEQREIAHLRL